MRLPILVQIGLTILFSVLVPGLSLATYHQEPKSRFPFSQKHEEKRARPAHGCRKVFCNQTLNLKKIPVIAYDMDYTLVPYQTVAWERQAYKHLRDRLEQEGLPVRGLRFNPNQVIPGLIVDMKQGNILKVND